MRFRSIAGWSGPLVAALTLTAPTGIGAQGKAQRVSAKEACVMVGASCTEWIQFPDGKARAMIYRTRPLTVRNAGIRRVLIMIHGTNRNADRYFASATSAAFLAGALDDTIVIAPSIRSSEGRCQDKLEPGEVSWGCSGDSWRSGGKAASDPALTSFDFIDRIVTLLANKRVFPNLEAIVIAGHSAGGQFVSRYAMANRVHDTAGVALSYVVANPSSYAWPDASRPLPEGDSAPDKAIEGWNSEAVHTQFSYGPFDAAKAPTYDRWPYGLKERTSGYTASIGDEQLKEQLASRPITYLLGQVDTLPLGGFDRSPAAMAQGATRRARGEAFVKYVNEQLGGHSQALIIPECGHNDRCIYTTDSALPYIFPALKH